MLLPLLGGCTPIGLANALTPGGYSLSRGLAYGAGPRQRLDLHLPKDGAAAAPLVVFFYGGNWESGERADYRFLAQPLVARGHAVAVPDYRLHPAARWPDFLEDGAAALAWLRGPAGRAAGAPAGPCFVMGHSAGGFIAAALALDPRWLAAAGLPGGRDALAGCIALAAPFYFQPQREPLLGIFRPAPEGRLAVVPETAAALRGAPPMLLLHGEADRTVRPEQSLGLAERLRAVGGRVRLVLYPGLGHIGIVAALAAPVRAAGLAGGPVLQDITGFLADAVAEAPGPRAEPNSARMPGP